MGTGIYSSVKEKCLRTASRFMRNEDGNFAAIAVLSLTVMVGIIGAGIDMAGVVSERTRLQDITDSAVLAASASGETQERKLRDIVDDVMSAHNNEIRAFTYKMTVIDDNIVVTANADHETAIMGMFGHKTLQISTESGAPVAQEVPVHVALVVDTTDSMSGDNLSSLQDAAEELITIIKRSKDAGAQMSVVPFGNYVNVGMANRDADWMDVPADYTETKACYMYRPVKSVSGCTTTSRTGYRDGVPYDYEGSEGCVYEYEDEDDEVEYCPPPKDIEWNGCAGSRNAPYNTVAAASNTTPIPGAMGESCGSELLPLTDDFGDVEDAIDDLTTNGNTYLPAGLIWGWRSLDPAAPYGAVTANATTVRAMVFMTDGGNTMSQFDKYGTGDEAYHHTHGITDTARQEKAKERMLALCNAAKADGITIFTVGYKLPDGAAGDSTTLESCASSASTAFSADNSNQLKKAFRDIGKSLATVRLTF